MLCRVQARPVKLQDLSSQEPVLSAQDMPVADVLICIVRRAVYEAVRTQLTGTAAGSPSRDPPSLNQSPTKNGGPPAIPKSLVDSLSKWKWSA